MMEILQQQKEYSSWSILFPIKRAVLIESFKTAARSCTISGPRCLLINKRLNLDFLINIVGTCQWDCEWVLERESERTDSRSARRSVVQNYERI